MSRKKEKLMQETEFLAKTRFLIPKKRGAKSPLLSNQSALMSEIPGAMR